MMNRLLALVLCLCFVLGGCAAEGMEEDGSLKAAGPATGQQTEKPIETASFEQLALALAALPMLPPEPDENALWETLSGASAEEQNKLWDEFSAQQSAYYKAVQTLRGDGVDTALTSSLAAYTLRTARQLFETTDGKNVVYSPANLYLALCMLAETTDSDSRAQVLGLLGLDSVEQARSAANSLWRNLYKDGNTGRTLLANSIWLNEQLDFHEDTVDTLADSYYASTFRAPMGDKATDAAIAEWINANTNGLLSDAAGALQTKPETLMMLISTLYFKGTWSDQFEAADTREDVFTNAKGAEQHVDFMHKSGNGNYYRRFAPDCGFTVAPIPFLDGTSMWFLLPDEGTTLSDALQLAWNIPMLAVDTSDGCYEIPDFASLAQAGYGEIHWSVPKFDVSSDLDLIPQLRALGVTDVFAEGVADFSPLTDLDAVVSAVKHAARVKVDEEGCEAAAFTAIEIVETELPPALPVVEMNLNRPFGFLITGADGLPLFISVVNTMA